MTGAWIGWRAAFRDWSADDIETAGSGRRAPCAATLPMIDVLALQAQRQPNAAMFIRERDVLTYGEAFRITLRLAQSISREVPAIDSMRLIGFAHRDPRWHLLISFALETLGITTLSMLQPAEADMARVLHRCDLIISEHPEALVQRPWLALTDAWLEKATQGHAEPWFRPALRCDAAMVAVLTTSGSSGAVKSLALNRKAHDLREHNRIWQYGLTSASRYLVAMPVTVSLINLVIRASLRCGAQVLLPSESQLVTAIAEATHTTLLPLGIRGLLHRIPASHPPIQELRCFATGASLSAGLRDGMIGRFNAQIQDSYGTNETGTVAWIGSDGVAEVLPDVDVEVVDEQLLPLPRGVPGTIRIRSAEMAQGYLDPAHDDGSFVDGWFITSDRGISISPRQFRLLGRIDSMLNIGGVKIAPEEVEDLLLRAGIAEDAGACGVADAAGIEQLHILLVRPRLGNDALIGRLGEILKPQFGDIKVAFAASIPRGHAGKIRRDALRQLLLAQTRGPSRRR